MKFGAEYSVEGTHRRKTARECGGRGAFAFFEQSACLGETERIYEGRKARLQLFREKVGDVILAYMECLRYRIESQIVSVVLRAVSNDTVLGRVVSAILLQTQMVEHLAHQSLEVTLEDPVFVR